LGRKGRRKKGGCDGRGRSSQKRWVQERVAGAATGTAGEKNAIQQGGKEKRKNVGQGGKRRRNNRKTNGRIDGEPLRERESSREKRRGGEKKGRDAIKTGSINNQRDAGKGYVHQKVAKTEERPWECLHFGVACRKRRQQRTEKGGGRRVSAGRGRHRVMGEGDGRSTEGGGKDTQAGFRLTDRQPPEKKLTRGGKLQGKVGGKWFSRGLAPHQNSVGPGAQSLPKKKIWKGIPRPEELLPLLAPETPPIGKKILPRLKKKNANGRG